VLEYFDLHLWLVLSRHLKLSLSQFEINRFFKIENLLHQQQHSNNDVFKKF
jgi:hypothetical protein